VRERESANGILVNLVAREGHQFSPSQADCAPVAGVLPASIFMPPDWRMNQFSDLVPNGMQVSGSIHFQHPGGPAAFRGYPGTLPHTHPLKTRIATLLQALHFMRDWQVNPFCRGFATSRSIISSLGFGLLSEP
jgi:hypothetical protein